MVSFLSMHGHEHFLRASAAREARIAKLKSPHAAGFEIEG
jgi:hypothetical protein